MKLLSSFFLLISIVVHLYGQSNIDAQITQIDPFNIDVNELNSVDIVSAENVAYMAYLQKDYTKALKYYLYIVKFNVDDASLFYSISCCYAQLNRIDFASDFLIMAINKGYSDFTQIEKEVAFDLIKSDPQFKNVLKDIANYSGSFGRVEYVEATKLIKCRVLVPSDYDPGKEYPLIVGLHGYSDRAENFCRLYTELNSPQFILVVPEAPYILNDGSGYMSPRYSWDFAKGNEDLWKRTDPKVVNYIADVVRYMENEYKIKRTYLLGFSQGVAYSYAAGINNPELVDGLICFAGRLIEPGKYDWFISESDFEKAKTLPVYIAHGMADKAIDYQKSVQAKKKLKKAGYKVEISLFEGQHYIPINELEKAIKWQLEYNND